MTMPGPGGEIALRRRDGAWSDLARLPPGDSQRIQRALEVFLVSGRPLSEWHAQEGAAATAPAAIRYQANGPKPKRSTAGNPQ